MKAIALGVLAAVTSAHKATDCFSQEQLVGGASEVVNSESAVVHSDIDELLLLGTDHVITSIKVCTNRAKTQLKGMQVSYGKFNRAGEIIDPVLLSPHGNLDQTIKLCENFYIAQGDFLSAVVYRYDLEGIKLLRFVTKNGESAAYGVFEDGDAQVFDQFSEESISFYGFVGLEEIIDDDLRMTALGLIYYDHACVRDEQLRLGTLFSWGDDIPNIYQNVDNFQETVVIQPRSDAITDGRERVEEMQEVFNRMTQWQRYVAYSSFGLNGFFLLWGLLYCILKCCCCRCGGESNKKIRKLERLLALQYQKSQQIQSSRLELAKQESSILANSRANEASPAKISARSPRKTHQFDEDELQHAQSVQSVNDMKLVDDIRRAGADRDSKGTLHIQPVIQYEKSGSKDWYEPKYSSRILPDGKQMEIVLEVPVPANQYTSRGGGLTASEAAAEEWAQRTAVGDRSFAEINRPADNHRLAQETSDANSTGAQRRDRFSGDQNAQSRSHQEIEVRDQELRRLSSEAYVKQIAQTLATYKRQIAEDQ